MNVSRKELSLVLIILNTLTTKFTDKNLSSFPNINCGPLTHYPPLLYLIKFFSLALAWTSKLYVMQPKIAITL